MSNYISLAYCWNNTNNIQFKLKVGNYTNIIDFLNVHKLSFLAKIDLPELPINLRGKTSKNLLEYLNKNFENTVLINEFLKYYITSIIKIRYASNKPLLFDIIPNNSWQNMNVQIIYQPATTSTTTTLPIVNTEFPYTFPFVLS